MADGHLGPRGCAKFHHNQRRGWECGPKISKFPRFAKESPRRREPFDRILKSVGDFIRLSILHQCFKFHVIRLTDNGAIAEKPRVGQLRRIFREPYRKLYTLDRKMNATFLIASTSSISMQSLGKIVQRAPCVGAKMWCLFLLRDVDMHTAYLLRQRVWVAGWVSVTAGIVSKRLNLSYNVFDLLVAPS